MSKSEQINELATALSKAQGAIAHASKDSENPFHKSKYADLANVWEACRKQLSENGLSIVQLPDGLEDGCLIMDTTLLHSSGQWISSRIKMPLPKQDPQGYGSALTYARRYALAAIVGVYQDDDDASVATGKLPQSTPKQQNNQGNTNIPTNAKKDSTPQLMSDIQRKKLFATATEKALSGDDMKKIINWKYKVDSSTKLTTIQASYLIDHLDELWSQYVATQSKAV